MAWQPAFASGSLASYSGLMDRCALRLCEQLDASAREGRPVDVWRALGTMTMGVRCARRDARRDARSVGRAPGSCEPAGHPVAGGAGSTGLSGPACATGGRRARSVGASQQARPPTPRCPTPLSAPQVVGTTAFGIDFHTMDDPGTDAAAEGHRLVGVWPLARVAARRVLRQTPWVPLRAARACSAPCVCMPHP